MEDYAVWLSAPMQRTACLSDTEYLTNQQWFDFEDALDLSAHVCVDRLRARILGARRSLEGVDACTYEWSYFDPAARSVNDTPSSGPPPEDVVARTIRLSSGEIVERLLLPKEWER